MKLPHVENYRGEERDHPLIKGSFLVPRNRHRL